MIPEDEGSFSHIVMFTKILKHQYNGTVTAVMNLLVQSQTQTQVVWIRKVQDLIVQVQPL